VEESGSLSIQSLTESSHREVLAGRASGDKRDSCELICVYLSNVGIALRPGPVPFEHGGGVRVDLHLPRDRTKAREI